MGVHADQQLVGVCDCLNTAAMATEPMPTIVLDTRRRKHECDTGCAGSGSSRRRLGGHVNNRLVSGSQALGDAATEPGGAFDGPLTLRPSRRPGLQSGDGVAVDLEPDRGTDVAGGLQGDRGERALVGIDPDGDHGLPSCRE